MEKKFSFSPKIERKRTACLLTPFHLRHYYDFLIEFRLASSTKDHNKPSPLLCFMTLFSLWLENKLIEFRLASSTKDHN